MSCTATVVLENGVNLAGIFHYGAHHSLDDIFQECGRAGRSGEQAISTVHWCPHNTPMHKGLNVQHKRL